jgi:putative transposase
MPWRETQQMEERMAFISDWRRQVRGDPQQVSMAELCRNYGVSRRCGYALIDRYERKGVAAFSDGSHAAHRHPNAVGGCASRR